MIIRLSMEWMENASVFTVTTILNLKDAFFVQGEAYVMYAKRMILTSVYSVPIINL